MGIGGLNPSPSAKNTAEAKKTKPNITKCNIKNEISFVTVEIEISRINILIQIYESLKKFLVFENQEQVSKINEFIQNMIISNLDSFLNNVVLVYGNSYFEKIINYNINIKIENYMKIYIMELVKLCYIIIQYIY